jgi:hypothetical protein
MLLQLEGREKQFVLDILKDCVCMFGRVMANDVEKGMKSFPGLRMKLNYFHKQLEAAKRWNTDEERVPVRPEWTTVDRILDTRCSLLGVVKKNCATLSYYYMFHLLWDELSGDELVILFIYGFGFPLFMLADLLECVLQEPWGCDRIFGEMEGAWIR